MPIGRTVFAQFMDLIPRRAFERCVARYPGQRQLRTFTCYDQFLYLAFAQLTYRESLRDIETCLRALQPKLYHAGLRGRVARSTLADANETRDWRIYADFEQLYRLTQHLACFVIRGKRGLAYARRGSRPVDKTTGLRSDQTIIRCGPKTATRYPVPLRRITFVDPETTQRFVFLKKDLQLDRSLYELLQNLSVTLFERVPIHQTLSLTTVPDPMDDSCNQLPLFDR
jgi:hypothetical protein